MSPKILTAEVVAVDLVHVVIICPVCGKFHRHGSNGSITKTNYGTRVPHCGDDDGGFKGEYELVTTAGTIRKQAITDKDLRRRAGDQQDTRANILQKRREKEEAEQDASILAAVREISAQGRKLSRWRIASIAGVVPREVTRWMHLHGIWYGDGHYQVISIAQAGPELCQIFKAPA